MRHRTSWRLAILIALVQVFVTRLAARGQPEQLDAVGHVLLIAGPVALAFRRIAPNAVFAVATAALVAYTVSDYPDGPVVLATLIALFAAVHMGRPAVTWVTVVVGFAVYVGLGHFVSSVGGWTVAPPPGLTRALVVAGWVVLAATVAVASKLRSARYAEVAKARAEVARARAEQQRRQASEERLRIARELHDVLGHHLSLINMQAGVGLHLMDTQPEQARKSLTAIKQASAEALREVRSVLAAMNPGDEAAPRTPAPGLGRVSDLVADAAAAGLPVTTEVVGAARELPSEVDRAAFRIVQEALTNVRRHAGPGTQATIVIAYADRELLLTIDDDGAGPPESSTLDSVAGGVPGMRERATALGGTLTAARRPGGGFRVWARLPTGEVL